MSFLHLRLNRSLLILGLFVLTLTSYPGFADLTWIYNSENNHSYAVVMQEMTWFEAYNYAEQQEYQGFTSHLVTITSASEQSWLETNMANGERYWLGATQISESTEPDGGWEWVTGEPWEYTHWRSTEPNDLTNDEDNAEFCNDGWWNDLGGYEVLYALLEVERNLSDRLRFASELVPCSSKVTVRLIDDNLVADEISLNLTTQQGDWEMIRLTIQDATNSIYSGSFPVGTGSINQFDMLLQASHADELYVTYEDQDDGSGNPFILSATATFDCQAPVVSNLETINVIYNQATITFNTDEPARARLTWAESCTGNFQEITTDFFSTDHTFQLNNLTPGTNYYFKIFVEDAVLNETISDNQGDCYTFSTKPIPSIFFDNFENGVASDLWEFTGTNAFNTRVTSVESPYEGEGHLVMDSSSNTYSRNEATITLNLEGFHNIILSFWAKSLGDEPHSPPSQPFIDGADFDGVAFSVDGVTWYEIQSLRSLTEEYQPFTLDLDSIVQDLGLVYGPQSRIRFNQYDNRPQPTDGIAIDLVSVDGDSIDNIVVLPASGLSVVYKRGEEFENYKKTYNLANDSEETITWEAVASEPWIEMSQTSGELGAGETVNVEVRILDSARFLSIGNYSADVSFYRQGSDFLYHRNIDLQIIPPAGLGLYALEFNSQQFAVVMQPELLTLNPNGPFTLEAWVYRRPEGSYWQVVLSKNNTEEYGLTVSSDEFLQFECGGNQLDTEDGSIPFNTWTHIASVWDGSRKYIYINGQLQTSIAWVGSIDNEGEILIGAGLPRTFENWNGYIDEVRIWSKARSANEINDTMNRILTFGQWPGLLANWSFSEGSGQTSLDSVQGITLRLGNSEGIDTRDPLWVPSEAPVQQTIALWTEELTHPYTRKSTVTVFGQLYLLENVASVKVNSASVALDPNGMFQIDVNLQDGENTILAEALDEQGNPLYSTDLILILDTQAPSLQISNPAQGDIFHALPITVFGEVGDVNPAVVWINNQKITLDDENAFEYLIDNIEEGPQYLTIYAEDAAGNRSGQVLLSVLYDTPPELTIDSPTDGSYVSSLQVRGRARDSRDTIDRVWVNGIPVAVSNEWYETELLAFTNDAYIINVTAEDSVGNQAQAQVLVWYDQTPPEILLYRPNEGQTFAVPYARTIGFCHDDSPVEIKVDGINYPVKSDGYFYLNIPLEEGANSLTIIAEDTAGNQCEPVTRNVTYDPDLIPDQPRVYTMDGFGRVEMGEAGTNSADTLQEAYLPRDMARDLELTSTGLGFWILRDDGWIDGFGDAERYSDASLIPVKGDSWCTPYFGWPIARDLEPYRGEYSTDSGYYILDGCGGIHVAGEALIDELPDTSERPYFGWDIARRIKVMSGRGYYLLDGFGGIHAVGNVPNFPDRTPYWGWDIARDFEMFVIQYETEYVSGDVFFKTLDDYALYVLDGFGGVHTAGTGQFAPSAYFGWDIAENLEIYGEQPPFSYIQIDGYGGRHWTNETQYSVFPAMTEPGFDIMRDVELFGMKPGE